MIFTEHDIRDIHAAAFSPGHGHVCFLPGMVILLQISLHCHFRKYDKPKGGKERKGEERGRQFQSEKKKHISLTL